MEKNLNVVMLDLYVGLNEEFETVFGALNLMLDLSPFSLNCVHGSRALAAALTTLGYSKVKVIDGVYVVHSVGDPIRHSWGEYRGSILEYDTRQLYERAPWPGDTYPAEPWAILPEGEYGNRYKEMPFPPKVDILLLQQVQREVFSPDALQQLRM